MKKMVLYGLWALQFILCAVLGFIHDTDAVGKIFQTILSVLFFVPAGILLADGIRQKDRKELLRLRIISISSLGTTLVLLIANVLSVGASATVGNVLFWILTVVSTPMVCSRYWVLTLFLWACLLMGSLSGRKPRKSA